MTMRILLTGGTGHLGRDIVRAAARQGVATRILSRRAAPPGHVGAWATGDLASGTGLDAAVAGVDAVVHAASGVKDPRASDVRGTAALVEAARRAGVRHVLYVSIIGIDRIPFDYYRAKLEAERAVEAGGVPFTILRAAQFHWFVDALLGAAARVPLLLPVPRGFRVQSIGTGDVAEEVMRLLAAGPQGRAPDLAGPEPMTLADAARQWARVRAPRKRVVEVPVPGALAAAFRAGHNTVPGRPRGRETFAEFLAATAPSSQAG